MSEGFYYRLVCVAVSSGADRCECIAYVLVAKNIHHGSYYRTMLGI